MNKVYQVYQVSDSTGETLDRIFIALKAQFSKFDCKTIHYSFTRTKNQIDKIISKSKSEKDVIILYTIVDKDLSKYLELETKKNNIPSFEGLGKLISDFSKLLKQEATQIPSGQHALDKEYYRRIEAVQFTMSHDDGKKLDDVAKADIVILGVSRTSKTPTSMYLANRGYKTANIPLVMDQKIPEDLKSKRNKTCIVGLVTDPERLADVRRNRVTIMKENNIKEYTDLNFIKEEINKSKNLFKKYNWPVIDVTRKSVEESAASILKIYEIQKSK